VTPRTYFRISLVLPLLVPAFVWPLSGDNYLATILVLAGLIAGVPYVPFAIGIWIKLGRMAPTLQVPEVIRRAPLLFIPVELIAFICWTMYQYGINWHAFYGLVLAPLIAIFTIAFGYFYVGMACALYEFLVRKRYVRVSELRTSSSEEMRE
jgi:hypothetical protein